MGPLLYARNYHILQKNNENNLSSTNKTTITNKKGVTMKGFSLVEVLVATFVLTIGILGFVELQIATLYNNHQAYLHSIADNQLQNLIERLRVSQLSEISPSELASWKSETSLLLANANVELITENKIIKAKLTWTRRGPASSTAGWFKETLCINIHI